MTRATPPVDRRKDDVVRIASDYALKAGDRVDNLVVVMGNATIEGHVLGDLRGGAGRSADSDLTPWWKATWPSSAARCG